MPEWWHEFALSYDDSRALMRYLDPKHNGTVAVDSLAEAVFGASGAEVGAAMEQALRHSDGT